MEKYDLAGPGGTVPKGTLASGIGVILPGYLYGTKPGGVIFLILLWYLIEMGLGGGYLGTCIVGTKSGGGGYLVTCYST